MKTIEDVVDSWKILRKEKKKLRKFILFYLNNLKNKIEKKGIINVFKYFPEYIYVYIYIYLLKF